MRTYKNYTDQDIIDFAKEVKSIASLLTKLGLKAAGGNYAHIKRKLQELSVDTSHWQGQGWSKDERLKDWSSYTRIQRLKPHLIQERGYKCEVCQLSSWMNSFLVLEVDHIDGDRTNNKLDNLKLLCPNCHSQTPTWRGRKN